MTSSVTGKLPRPAFVCPNAICKALLEFTWLWTGVVSAPEYPSASGPLMRMLNQSCAFHTRKNQGRGRGALSKNIHQGRLWQSQHWTQILQKILQTGLRCYNFLAKACYKKSIFHQYWLPPTALFLCWGKPIFQCNFCQQWIDEGLILEKLWTTYANLYCDSWENRVAIFHRDVLRTDTWKIIRCSDTNIWDSKWKPKCNRNSTANITSILFLVYFAAATKDTWYFSCSPSSCTHVSKYEFQLSTSNHQHIRKKEVLASSMMF